MDRLAEALALAREHGVSWFVPTILTGIGFAKTDLGDLAGAIAALDENLSLAQRRGNLRDLIDALEGLARIGAATGQMPRAARLFGAAATLREEIALAMAPIELEHFAPIMNRLRDALGQDGFMAAWAEGRSISQDEAIEQALAIRADPVRTAALSAERQLAAAHGLTARELEVLRLVAAGRSNQEIGELLFISRTTAARHVANIFTKLDFDARAQAMAYAHAQGLV